MIKLGLVALSIMTCLCTEVSAADFKGQASFQEPQDRQESSSKEQVKLPGPPGNIWYAAVVAVLETNLNMAVSFPPKQFFITRASRNTEDRFDEGHTCHVNLAPNEDLMRDHPHWSGPEFKGIKGLGVKLPYDCWRCWAWALGVAIQDSIARRQAYPAELHKADFLLNIKADHSMSAKLIYSSFSKTDTERLQEAISSLSGDRLLTFPTIAYIEPDVLKNLNNKYHQKYGTTFDVEPGPVKQTSVEIQLWSRNFTEDLYPSTRPNKTSLNNWQ